MLSNARVLVPAAICVAARSRTCATVAQPAGAAGRVGGEEGRGKDCDEDADAAAGPGGAVTGEAGCRLGC